MILKPLLDVYGLRRIVVSTYQSITGTGKRAVDQMEGERSGRDHEAVYPYKIDQNCLPHCDSFLDNAYTKEEMKLVNESRKILGLPNLRITATAVRVPVVGGHSESVNIELEKPFDLKDVRKLLANTPGIVLQDDPANNLYPMPLPSQGKDEVFVGRVRRDESVENGLNLWIVADNLRKGAATNAVQIAEYLIREKIFA
jgi:aspartate-semialdehyde dehydrogenase